MRVIYARQPFPDDVRKSIFLAGPTPRSRGLASWRPEAIRLLEARGYDGDVYDPEVEAGEWQANYDDQVAWEDEGLNRADCILFWVPRDLETMPAFTTNHEHGEWFKSGKCVLAAPDGAPKMRYLRDKAGHVGVPQAATLEGAVDAAVAMLGDGALRRGGETQVPLHVWRTPSFQSWYQAQKKAGNRLDGAKVEWVLRLGTNRKPVFYWALRIDVFIAAEGRHKTNEVVISRPDVSALVLRGPDRGRGTEIVLVREFRSPAGTDDGFVREVPSGSSFKPQLTPAQLAVEEAMEETGLRLDPWRLREIGRRQLVATMSAHKAHVFTAELTAGEIEALRGQAGVAHGVAEDTERTYVEIRTLGELLDHPLTDWSMMGMILTALSHA